MRSEGLRDAQGSGGKSHCWTHTHLDLDLAKLDRRIGPAITFVIALALGSGLWVGFGISVRFR